MYVYDIIRVSSVWHVSTELSVEICVFRHFLVKRADDGGEPKYATGMRNLKTSLPKKTPGEQTYGQP